MDVYRLRVGPNEYDGLVFDVGANTTTVLELMTFICTEWLDKYIRKDDGAVDDHLWKLYRPVPSFSPSFIRERRLRVDEYDNRFDDDVHVHDDDDGDAGWDFQEEQEVNALYGYDDIDPLAQWNFEDVEDSDDSSDEEDDEDHLDAWVRAQTERDNGIPHNETLSDISGFVDVPGAKIHVDYDFGSTTSFDIHFISRNTIPHNEENASFPRVVPSAADEAAKRFCPFCTPEGSPSLDDVFPHANNMIFQSENSSWLCPYPTSTTSSGFVEVDGKSSDLTFMPETFSNLQEALVAMDIAFRKYPQSEGYSRVLFPMKMDKEAEDSFLAHEEQVNEYLKFRKEHSESYFYGRNGIDFDKLNSFSDNIQARFFCPDIEVLVRVSEVDYNKYDTMIDSLFPMCAKAYKKGLWASYRRGRVVVSKKKASREHPNERGIPNDVLAEVSYEVTSLHQFFCVCEELFRRVDANRIFESLKESVTAPSPLLSV